MIRALALLLVVVSSIAVVGFFVKHQLQQFRTSNRSESPMAAGEPAGTSASLPAAIPKSPRLELAQGQFAVNGSVHERQPEVAAWVGGRLIDLDVQERPAKEIAAELTKLFGREVSMGYQEEDQIISLSLQRAGFFDALTALCQAGGWTFTLFSQPGYPAKVEREAFGGLRKWSVEGPLLFGWYPDDEHSLKLRIDPDSSAFFKDVAINPEFTATLADGTTRSLQASSEAQDGMGGRAWKLGERVIAVSVSLPLAGLTERHRIESLWEPGQGESDEVALAVEDVSSKAESKLGPDFKRVERQVHRARFRLTQAGALAFADGSSGRATSRRQKELIDSLPEGGVLHAHDAWAVDKDGNWIQGRIEGGTGGPWNGYAFEAVIETTDASFKPAKLGIGYANGYAEADVSFQLSGLWTDPALAPANRGTSSSSSRDSGG